MSDVCVLIAFGPLAKPTSKLVGTKKEVASTSPGAKPKPLVFTPSTFFLYFSTAFDETIHHVHSVAVPFDVWMVFRTRVLSI